jgi:hypothetical protein
MTYVKELVISVCNGIIDIPCFATGLFLAIAPWRIPGFPQLIKLTFQLHLNS